MLALVIAMTSAAEAAALAIENSCGGVIFGYQTNTNCCVPDGVQFKDERTGKWPSGSTYDYTSQRCDPICGIVGQQ